MPHFREMGEVDVARALERYDVESLDESHHHEEGPLDDVDWRFAVLRQNLTD
jgi:hypothetical protein